ncbi:MULTISPECIES: hypothetical protein [unclassified Gemella]|uniref:hypothetical protein n=1 Tax=unclassified Gemella TaxID=2624949 RepID=UPI001C050C9F|nr:MULTISPECIES: hypothetical protein [unclassified Gemella]MBU0279241.1 hypothetical protein [Gemella sp. zg-1178]QWQ39048.1 hypothetical protein KMP11_01565 [Gemella sp. zg-570]
MSKKIIVPTGYMGSGSSAVTDILREYKGINTKNADYEYIFLHMPDGVFDLEDKLLLNNNALRSDEAIKNFRNKISDLYSLRGWWPGNYKKYVSANFLDIVDKYIQKIKFDSFSGVWYYNEKYRGFKLYKRAIINRSLKLFNKPPKLDKFDIEYTFIKEDKFYQYTGEFIEDFVEELNKDSEKDIVLDQLLLPHNVYRLDNYAKYLDIKVVIVERDPRDVFIMNKYVWVKNGVPVLYPEDVYKFCRYYKEMRENERKNNYEVLRIKFEDLIFNYDNSIKMIEAYLNLDSTNHIKKRKYFNPDISINNIQIYKQEKYKEEVAVIEKELENYLHITNKEVVSNANPF